MKSGKTLFFASVLVLVVLFFLIPKDPNQTNESAGNISIHFYCAAGMKPPVEKIARQYEEEYGVTVQLQYGGSGTLLSNIEVSQTGDLYLAADETYVELAKKKGLVAESLPLASLTPVIVVQKGNPKNIQTLEDLMREDIGVALANPEAASVGKVTKQILEEAGLWDDLKENTEVFKPTVNDVANDVKIGAVDAAIVWDAVAAQYPDLEMIHADVLEKGKSQITVAVLKSSKQPTQTLKFMRYLGAKEKGAALFAETGYTPVESDEWEENPVVTLYSGGVNRVAIDDTIEEFEAREGVTVNRVYNGCGILVAQMKTGDRPDAYFACDVSFSKQVTDLFLDFTDVSETSMVILTQKDNPRNIKTLADLGSEGLQIGIANPKQSALGALTVRLLEDVGVLDSVMKNVRSQTPTADLLVNQTQTGSLDAAVVYEANTSKVKDKLDVIPIDHPSAIAIQPFAVGRKSKHGHLMERLFDAIQSQQSKAKFKAAGFKVYGDEQAE